VSPWRAPVAVAAAALIVLAFLNLRPRPEVPGPERLPELVEAVPEPADPVQAPELQPTERLDEPPTDGTVESPLVPPVPQPRIREPEEVTPSADAVADVEPDERIVVLDAVGESLLASFGGWTSAQPDSRLALRYRGEGLLSAGGDDFEIRWDTGRLEVAVEPDAGIRLAVVTAEARIAIVGTAFSVTSGSDGTRVEVSRGVVRVRCHGQQERRFAAAESTICAPVDPQRLARRAVKLHLQDGACVDVLAALGPALDRWPSDGSERTYAMALNAEYRCLHELGDLLEAKEAAEALVDFGPSGHRADAQEYLRRWRGDRP
jgi:hypothetical protein